MKFFKIRKEIIIFGFFKKEDFSCCGKYKLEEGRSRDELGFFWVMLVATIGGVWGEMVGNVIRVEDIDRLWNGLYVG